MDAVARDASTILSTSHSITATLTHITHITTDYASHTMPCLLIDTT